MPWKLDAGPSALLSRRDFAHLSVAAVVAGTLTGRTTSQRRVGAVHLRRPTLQNARLIRVENQPGEGPINLDLRGMNQDWIVQLPDEPLRRGLRIDGSGEARNVVLRRGSIEPELQFDAASAKRNGRWAVYSDCQFTGAVGGTFRMQTASRGPFTTALAWNAPRTEIKAALERVLGVGAVAAVEGSDAPGGPWRIVAADDRLGHVSFDLSGLAGAISQRKSLHIYRPADTGLVLADWRGTMHVEGLFIGGDGCCEGVDVHNPIGSATLQFANVRIEARFDRHQADWHHVDALQCWLGPAELRMERCDVISYGRQAFMGQPRQESGPDQPLEALRDWSFRDCLFEARENRNRRTPRLPGVPCYMEDDWPANNLNHAGWTWRMANCYASRVNAAGRQLPTPQPRKAMFNHWPHEAPPGIKLGARPRAGAFLKPRSGDYGIGYRSSTAVSPQPTVGQLRLVGERLIG